MKRYVSAFVVLVVALLVASCAPVPVAPAAPAQAPAADQPTQAPTDVPAGPATEAPAAEGQGTDLQAIMAKGKLVCGTSADYAPFEYVEKDGSFAGFDMDFIREVASRLGVEVEIVDMGFDGLVTAVQEGKIDCAIAAMAATPERSAKVDFTVTYHKPAHSFLVKKDSTIKLDKPEDAAQYKLAVQTGTTLDDWATKNLVDKGLMPENQLSRYERADQAALDLQAGRVDLFLLDRDTAVDLMTKMPLEIALSTELYTTGDAIALRKGSTELKAALDKVIGELDQEGYIKELTHKYFPDVKTD